MQVDFLIVGQGLAGTALALELLKRKKKIIVMASPQKPCASTIAAGLYNPITGNKLTKTWKADALFEVVEPFYKAQESLLAEKFLHQIGIYRPFTSTDEQNDWVARTADDSYAGLISRVSTQPHPSNMFHDSLGGIFLTKSGFVDTKKYLLAAKKYLLSEGMFIEELFQEENLSIGDRQIQYNNLEANHLVLCNGLGATEGNLFGWLPFHKLKGEILTIKTTLSANTVFNRGCFMLPESDGVWKVGSTYNWRKPDDVPSSEGLAEIREKLERLYKGALEVVGHQAGIRPSTKDRRPFLGRHPGHKNIFIFNGLGTKGVSLSAYFANEMAEFMINGAELGKEVDIERYFSLYFERNVG